MNDYVALLEVRPTDPAALGPDVEGAFVRVFAHAPDEHTALELMKAELTIRGVAVAEVEWLVDNAEVEWENPDPAGQQDRWVALARTEGVQVSEFQTWGAESEE